MSLQILNLLSILKLVFRGSAAFEATPRSKPTSVPKSSTTLVDIKKVGPIIKSITETY